MRVHDLPIVSDGEYALCTTPTGPAGLGLSAVAVLQHQHDDAYAPLTHDHDDAYAPLTHDHDDAYAPHGAITWYVVQATGSDETGDGSAAAPWRSFERALVEAQARGVETVPLTISFSKGLYAFRDTFPPLPPHLTLIGADPTITTIQAVAPHGDLTPNGMPLLITNATPPPSAAAEVIIFKTSSGGTAPDTLYGAYEVLSVDGDQAVIIFGESDPLRIPSGAMTATAIWLPTKIFTFGDAPWLGDHLELHNIGLAGHESNHGLQARTLTLRNVGIRNFDGRAVTCLSGGRMAAEWLAVSHCQFGLTCHAGSICDAQPFICSRLTDGWAATCAAKSALIAPRANIYGSPHGVNAEWGAMVDISGARLVNVADIGIRARWLSGIDANRIIIDETPIAIDADHLSVVGTYRATITGSITPPISPQPFAFVTDQE